MNRLLETRIFLGRRFLWPGVLVALLTLIACAKEPTDLKQRAHDAVEAARSVQAENYAPAEFRTAVDALGLANEELAAQQGRFALARKFGRAEELFRSAEQSGKSAETAAIANKQAAKDEALATVASIQSMVTEVEEMFRSPEGQAMLRDRRTGPGMRLLRDEITDVDTSLRDIEDSLENLQNQDALAMARAAKAQAVTIHSEVGQALRTGVVPSRGDK